MPSNLHLSAKQVAALIHPDCIQLAVRATAKTAAIAEVAAGLAGGSQVSDLDAFLAEILAREEAGNTALGAGVAMPHARTDLCRDIVIAVGRSPTGIDYGAADGQPVSLVFLIGTPMQQIAEYLRIVGRLAYLLSQEEVRRRLLAADSPANFLAILSAGTAT
jgi:mannitol/fructose-specific phosphotransferase system IIA component (Ntr-type)